MKYFSVHLLGKTKKLLIAINIFLFQKQTFEKIILLLYS